MTGHQQIARPKVTVTAILRSTAGHVDHIASCTHCAWSYRNLVKSDVAYQATQHRRHHRAGTVEVTR